MAGSEPLRRALGEVCGALGARCDRLAEELESLGIEAYLEAGSLELGGHRLLGKGWASIVFLARSKRWGIVAVKALRPGSRRRSMLPEAAAWLAASLAGAAPRLHAASLHALIYEPVKGPALGDYVPRGRAEALLVLRRLLYKAYMLDTIGLRHNELARPEGQVLVDAEEAEPYIIDYDSATWSGPGNLTQLIGGLPRTPLGRQCRIHPGSEALRGPLRRYKQSGPDPAAYHEIARLVTEACLQG